MKEILKYHLIPNDALFTSNLFPIQMVANADGSSIRVAKDQSAWMVDGAKVLLPDLRVSNGVIWLIDRVLTPQDLQQGTQGNQQPFQGFIGGQTTPFANLNQALSQGPRPDVNQGDIDQRPAYRQGGVAQAVSQWAGPQGRIQQQADQGQQQESQEGSNVQQGSSQWSNLGNQNQNQAQVVKSIAERVMANPQLTTFAFLLNDPRYSEIVQLLSGPGPVTVFIPTNDAFSKSGIDTTNVAMVRELLKHHIVQNMAITTSDFLHQKLFDAEGNRLKISRTNAGWMVDDANIVVPDIQAKNGVIFLIDRVLTHINQAKGQAQGTPNRGQGGRQHGFEAVQSAPVDNRHSAWHGAGLYCAAQSDLYYCNEKSECVLQESCKNGCVHAEAGFPDYCFVQGQKGSLLPNVQLPNLNRAPFQRVQQQGGQ